MLKWAANLFTAALVAGMFGFGAGKDGASRLVRLFLSVAVLLASIAIAFTLIGAIIEAIWRAVRRKNPLLAPRFKERIAPIRQGAPVPSAYGA
ncbi:MAG: hypothetical protein AB7P23_11375 [Amphiplicatus sp.]